MAFKERQKIKIEKQRLLLVEGKDEVLFFGSYLNFLKIDNIQILEVKGKEQFRNEIPKLRVLQRFPDVVKIGLVRDADTDFNAALESVYDRLVSNLFEPIKEHNKFSSKNPSIGIFIMPKFGTNGSLEDLCLEAVDIGSQLFCSNDFIKCIKVVNPEIDKISKRKVQIYLASQKKICNNLGIGAQKKYWNFESSVYNEIKKFIEELAK